MACDFAAVAATHAIVRYDTEGNVLAVNDVFCQLTGQTAEKVVGKKSSDITVNREMSETETRTIWRKVAAGESSMRLEPWKRAEPGTLWVNVSYSVVCNDQGKPLYVLALGRDVTEQQIRNRDFRGQVEAVKRSMAVIEFDLKGNILAANENFQNTMGYTDDEIIGKHHSLFVPKSDLTGEAYRKFWENLGKGSVEAGIVRRVAKNGKTVWLKAIYTTVFGPEGRPEKVVKYALDVSEERNLAALADGQVEAIKRVQAVIEFDTKGNILRSNKNFCDTMGYDQSDLVGKHHSMFCDPAYVKTAEYKEFWEKLRAGEEHNDHFVRYARNGESVYLSASYNPVRNADGRVEKIVKFAVDTTVFERALVIMASALERVAAGDLTVEISNNMGEIDALRLQFNAAIASQRRAMVSVASKSIQLEAETNAISGATDELAKRSETQAATLVESVAALDAIVTSVTEAAKSANDARELAGETKTHTEQSNAVVTDAVKSMDEISTSSKKISSITGVIDDIAFQTNLLALNAGVEAARAGEAGRGFAVVASEVRELAQRSSNAAKEIADLISASTVQVNKGVESVGRAGDALTVIENRVNKIYESVEEIAQFTNEQATGLHQINAAMNQLDAMTQQNAAMSEETNAAAYSLKTFIGEMQADVGYFKTDNDAGPTQSASGLQAKAG